MGCSGICAGLVLWGVGRGFGVGVGVLRWLRHPICPQWKSCHLGVVCGAKRVGVELLWA